MANDLDPSPLLPMGGNGYYAPLESPLTAMSAESPLVGGAHVNDPRMQQLNQKLLNQHLNARLDIKRKSPVKLIEDSSSKSSGLKVSPMNAGDFVYTKNSGSTSDGFRQEQQIMDEKGVSPFSKGHDGLGLRLGLEPI